MSTRLLNGVISETPNEALQIFEIVCWGINNNFKGQANPSLYSHNLKLVEFYEMWFIFLNF